MARLKKGSRHLNKAAIRLAGLKSIDNVLDLGNDLTLAKFEMAINELQAELQAYNTILSVADEKLNIVQESERSLRDLTSRMLTGVASKYGMDSNEYEKAGGVKKSKRNRRKRKILYAIAGNDVIRPGAIVAPLFTAFPAAPVALPLHTFPVYQKQ